MVGHGYSLLFFALKREAAFDVRSLTSDTHSGSKRYVSVDIGVWTMGE